MNAPLERVVLITGHYGSGKTNLAVNLALTLKRQGRLCVLCDLDIVNPYFRSADFETLMHQNGIETISPVFANTNLDMPSLGAGLSAVLSREDRTVIVDVGGDDAGAIALGRYAPEVLKRPFQMLYVWNYYRYLTHETADALQMLQDITAVSRLSCTHIVNNSNLGQETDARVIEASMAPAAQLAKLCGLPVLCTAIPRALASQFPETDAYYPVDIYVRKPWDPPSSSDAAGNS